MANAFRRTGDLKSIGSYPVWLQRVVHETASQKRRVVQHELFSLMRDARLPLPVMQRFLVGVWPTIEQFPRFMAMNLKKAGYGEGAGVDMARRYLIQNIRVEQKHAEHWANWAGAAGLSLDDLRSGVDTEELQALAHWCWYVCDHADLAVAMAATNYAVEGATGEWSCVVCSQDTYAKSLPEEVRSSATRWLRVHAGIRRYASVGSTRHRRHLARPRTERARDRQGSTGHPNQLPIHGAVPGQRSDGVPPWHVRRDGLQFVQPGVRCPGRRLMT